MNISKMSKKSVQKLLCNAINTHQCDFAVFVKQHNQAINKIYSIMYTYFLWTGGNKWITFLDSNKLNF